MNKPISLYLRGFLLVFFTGFIWSFGVVLVRHMEDGHLYQFQYLFYRGLGVAVILMIYLIWREGLSFYKNLYRLGWSGIIGGFCLALAMMFFVLSITQTSVAITLFMLASMPFFTAILGYFVLNERLSRSALYAMILAFIGVAIMAYSDLLIGTGWGALMGFLAACAFSIFTVTLRIRVETPRFTTVVFAGIVCTIISISALWLQNQTLVMPTLNLYLSLAHGSIIGFGLILYSIGAKYLPAAELTLLSLMEVVGGIIWVAIPLFGIKELPTLTTIIGGSIICAAVIFHGVAIRRTERPPLP